MTEPVGAGPIVWMRALRDRPEPVTAHRAVLWALALRMRKDGTGWVPQRLLAEGAGVNERTVRRALTWAVSAGLLEQTRRGHRRGDGVVRASEYRLLLPSQPDTGVLLNHESLPDSSDSLPDNRAPQPDTGVHPRGLGSRGLDSSVPSFDGAPDGALEELQDLESHNFKSAFDLGQHIAELCNEGKVQFAPEQFRDLAVAKFGFEGEREAWAGHHRFRCKPIGLCVCHDEVPW